MLKNLIKRKAKKAIKELFKEAIKTAKDIEYSVEADKTGKMVFKVKVKKIF